eukprot:930661-Amphidinium_carterae.1
MQMSKGEDEDTDTAFTETSSSSSSSSSSMIHHHHGLVGECGVPHWPSRQPVSLGPPSQPQGVAAALPPHLVGRSRRLPWILPPTLLQWTGVFLDLVGDFWVIDVVRVFVIDFARCPNHSICAYVIRQLCMVAVSTPPSLQSLFCSNFGSQVSAARAPLKLPIG